MNCDMLLVDPTVNQHIIYSKCMKERKLFEKIISISDLLSLSSSSYLLQDPFLINEDTLSLFTNEHDLDKIYDQVQKYYEQLSDSIQDALKKKKKEDCDRIQALMNESKSNQQILRVSLTVNKIQQLLISENMNSENMLHEYIVKHCNQTSQEIQSIKLSKAKYIEWQISSEQAIQIQKQILQQIESINLFNKQSQIPVSLPNNLFQNEVQSLNILKKWDLNTSKCLVSNSVYSSKDHLEIFNKKNQIIINYLASSQGECPQCYLYEQLDQNKKYIITISLQIQSISNPNYYIGILNVRDKDSKHMYEQKIYYNEWNQDYFNTIIKGSKEKQNKKIGLKTLEFRICLKDRFFRVSSPPNYQNISELNKGNMINAQQAYCFAMILNAPGDSVIIESVIEVPSFNNNM